MPRARADKGLKQKVWPKPFGNAHVMKCILNITRSDVIRTPNKKFGTRESNTSRHVKFLEEPGQERVFLVDKKFRLTLGVEQKT